MQEYVLVVVDMQPCFSASSDPATLAAVEREVEAAVSRRFPVVILEIPYWSPLDWPGNPPTQRTIMERLKGYDRCAKADKTVQDGSRHVACICKEKNWERKRFRVVGVNTDACIKDTVRGLSEREETELVEVVQDACNTSTRGWDGWDDLRRFDKVVVLATGD